MTREICSREKCTGCAACFNACPTSCISMEADIEGFPRPVIDLQACNDCGLCRKVCPILCPPEPNPESTKAYACWNKDEQVRFRSASGGAFSAFAESVLEEGGIVFGAAYDENVHLRHLAINRKEDLGRLRSSKYVQSEIGDSYNEVKNFVEQGRKVLFSGTPCQVAGLLSILGDEKENLFTCDMLCHGVPSPGLFSGYVQYLEKRFGVKVANLNVRHKRKGWGLNSSVVSFSDGREIVLNGLDDSFMFGFINCFSLRPSCYLCPYTNTGRHGDITMGDFWGIGEQVPFRHETRHGISLILVNSEKGHCLFEKSSGKLHYEERSIEEAKHKRSKLSHPLPKPGNRDPFYADYQRMEYEELARKHLVDKGLKGFIKRFVPREWIFYARKSLEKLRSSR